MKISDKACGRENVNRPGSIGNSVPAKKLAARINKEEQYMKIADLLGAVMQSGMSPSSNDRIQNSLGGGNMREDLLF